MYSEQSMILLNLGKLLEQKIPGLANPEYKNIVNNIIRYISQEHKKKAANEVVVKILINLIISVVFCGRDAEYWDDTSSDTDSDQEYKISGYRVIFEVLDYMESMVKVDKSSLILLFGLAKDHHPEIFEKLRQLAVDQEFGGLEQVVQIRELIYDMLKLIDNLKDDWTASVNGKQPITVAEINQQIQKIIRIMDELNKSFAILNVEFAKYLAPLSLGALISCSKIVLKVLQHGENENKKDLSEQVLAVNTAFIDRLQQQNIRLDDSLDGELLCEVFSSSGIDGNDERETEVKFLELLSNIGFKELYEKFLEVSPIIMDGKFVEAKVRIEGLSHKQIQFPNAMLERYIFDYKHYISRFRYNNKDYDQTAAAELIRYLLVLVQRNKLFFIKEEVGSFLAAVAHDLDLFSIVQVFAQEEYRYSLSDIIVKYPFLGFSLANTRQFEVLAEILKNFVDSNNSIRNKIVTQIIHGFIFIEPVVQMELLQEMLIKLEIKSLSLRGINCSGINLERIFTLGREIKIRSLDLSNCGIDMEFDRLSQTMTLANVPSLMTLRLTNNRFTVAGITGLFKCLKGSRVIKLELASDLMFFTPEISSIVMDGLKGTEIREIDWPLQLTADDIRQTKLTKWPGKENCDAAVIAIAEENLARDIQLKDLIIALTDGLLEKKGCSDVVARVTSFLDTPLDQETCLSLIEKTTQLFRPRNTIADPHDLGVSAVAKQIFMLYKQDHQRRKRAASQIQSAWHDYKKQKEEQIVTRNKRLLCGPIPR